MINFLRKNAVWIVFGASVLFSVLATIHYFHLNEVLAYNDARSRLDIARRVTDSNTPGIVQLGTVWLPLPQFLIFPFVANDYLWKTGLGASIVSMTAYVVTSVYIFKTAFLLTKRTCIGVVSALLFMLNINILYMQTTAMTEILLTATMVTGLFYFTRWLLKKKDIDLVYSALAISLATLVRYEAWLMLIACAGIIYFENRHKLHNAQKAQGQAILFATLGSLGIVLWFLWNMLFFGSPLYFLTGQQGQYSLSGHASDNQHNIFATLETMWRTLGYNVGFVTLAAIVLLTILIFVAKTKQKRFDLYVLLLLLTPVMVNIFTLYTGTTTINATSLSRPFGMRYGLCAVVLAAVVFAMGVSRIKIFAVRFGLTVGALLLLLTVQPSSYLGAVNGGRSLSPKTKEFISAMQEKYKGGKILASTYAFDPAMQALGYPLKNYIYEGNGDLWKDSLINPQRHATYIYMHSGVAHDPVYDAYNNNRALFNQYYKLIYYKNGFRVMQLKSALDN